MYRDRIARMKSRNTELREQVDATKRENSVLRGMDVENFSVTQLDELRQNLLNAMVRIDNAKLDVMQIEIQKRDHEQAEKMKEMYGEAIEKMMAKKKDLKSKRKMFLSVPCFFFFLHSERERD